MRRLFLLIAAVLFATSVQPMVAADSKSDEVVMVVMDPLALELSCPCVKGYAQRNYHKLAAHLTKQLNKPVKVYFSETVTGALTKKTGGRADILIGKHSVVLAGASENKMQLNNVASLTGKDGKTTQTGLWVVADKDPALAVEDLKGHELFFGPADAAEKHQAAIKLLKDFSIGIPSKPSICTSCTDAATKVLEAHKAGKKAAGVVSSYAQPLLEGCGTIKKGELRVIGETETVPFIVAFVNSKLPSADQKAIQKALLTVGKDADLCKLMETKKGFVLPETPKKK